MLRVTARSANNQLHMVFWGTGPRRWGPAWGHIHPTGWAPALSPGQERCAQGAWQALSRQGAAAAVTGSHSWPAAGCQGNGLFPTVTAGAFLLGPLHRQASPSISAAFLFRLVPPPLSPGGHISPSSGQTVLLALPLRLLFPDRQPGRRPRLPHCERCCQPDGRRQAMRLSAAAAASSEPGRSAGSVCRPGA